MSSPESRPVDVSVDEVARLDFWKDHFPNLTILERASAHRDGEAWSPASLELASERMRVEGYFQERSDTLACRVPALADGVHTCKRLGIPLAFLFLFDETWECFDALHPVLAHFLGPGYRALPDFWTWHVDPRAGEAGWGPHRDKGRVSLAADGTPLSLTVWVPLSEATPQNSCMYMLPADRDPAYNTVDDDQWQIDFPAVRAVPAKPGDFLCWNQAVLHWGGQTSRFASNPRLSMALEFQRGDVPAFNRPLLEPFDRPALETRLQLVAKQVLQYRHMVPLPARFESLALRLVQGV